MCSSCATIFTGTQDTITFETVPSGATVYLNGNPIGKTPLKKVVKRNINSVEAQVKLAGYAPQSFDLEREFNFVSIINLGDVLGWAIDVATGSIMKYSRLYYNIELEPQAGDYVRRNDTFTEEPAEPFTAPE